MRLSMLCPGLLSHLSCPQAAHCLHFDLYETRRKDSLLQRRVNAVNDQSATLPCSGHVQLQRLCVGLNPAAQQLCLQERREAAVTGKIKASETIPFFPVCRKSREGLASNSHGDFFIKRQTNHILSSKCHQASWELWLLQTPRIFSDSSPQAVHASFHWLTCAWTFFMCQLIFTPCVTHCR